MKIHFTADLPDELAQEFLQHLRDFDMKHDPNHENKIKMYIFPEGKCPTAEDAVKLMMSMNPPPQFVSVRKAD
jgi:hypothetical protein